MRLNSARHWTRSIDLQFGLLFALKYLLFRGVRDNGETSTLRDFLIRSRLERLGAHRENGLTTRFNRNDLFLDGTAIATALEEVG